MQPYNVVRSLPISIPSKLCLFQNDWEKMVFSWYLPKFRYKPFSNTIRKRNGIFLVDKRCPIDRFRWSSPMGLSAICEKFQWNVQTFINSNTMRNGFRHENFDRLMKGMMLICSYASVGACSLQNSGHNNNSIMQRECNLPFHCFALSLRLFLSLSVCFWIRIRNTTKWITINAIIESIYSFAERKLSENVETFHWI